MSAKSFFLGLLAGVVLTISAAYVISEISQDSSNTSAIKYFEKPLSYENKKKTSFKVIQVFDDAALANENSGGTLVFFGTTVLIQGENFYDDQIITITNPRRVGSFSYTNKMEERVTVPVVDGEMSE